VQIERKRHIGNDIIVLVFTESEAPFRPQEFHSHFNRTTHFVRRSVGQLKSRMIRRQWSWRTARGRLRRTADIFLVVKPIRDATGAVARYRVSLACKKEVPPFPPELFAPAEFPVDDPFFRDWIFYKSTSKGRAFPGGPFVHWLATVVGTVVNGERAILHHTPAFADRLIKARRQVLEDWDRTYAGNKSE
jgi:hypothetical protein